MKHKKCDMEVVIKKITSVDKSKTRIHHGLTFYFDDESLQMYEINKWKKKNKKNRNINDDRERPVWHKTDVNLVDG